MRFLFAILIIANLAVIIPGNVYAQKGWKTYTVENEYSFNFPSSSWELIEKKNRFSYDVTLENYEGETAVITFIHGPEYHYLYRGSIDSIGTMKSLQHDDLSIFESGSDKYVINNQTAPYVISTYTQTDPYKEVAVLTIAISLEGNNTVIAEYYTVQNDFDKHLGDAEKIFQSIKPVNHSAQ